MRKKQSSKPFQKHEVDNSLPLLPRYLRVPVAYSYSWLQFYDSVLIRYAGSSQSLRSRRNAADLAQRAGRAGYLPDYSEAPCYHSCLPRAARHFSSNLLAQPILDFGAPSYAFESPNEMLEATNAIIHYCRC